MLRSPKNTKEGCSVLEVVDVVVVPVMPAMLERRRKVQGTGTSFSPALLVVLLLGLAALGLVLAPGAVVEL